MPRPFVSASSTPAPQPVLIEAAGHACLAWWHAPAPAAAQALAVVLASSWGDEDMAGYEAQRALAVALAQGGLGTLRFEWPDSGDSSAVTGAVTIADLLDAFEAAARRALALSGRERLAFAGRGLGALLAAHAALARQDVDALVLLAPPDSGAAFVHAQSAGVAVGTRPAAAMPPGAVVDPAELPVALGGFTLPARRLDALTALRWPGAATTSVLEALLVRPPHCGGHATSDALALMGVRVREAGSDPDADGAAAVVGWLRERAADPSVLHGVPAIEGFGVADAGNAGVHARLAAARLEAATTALLALAATAAPVWMRLRDQGVALRERVVHIADGRGPVLAGVLCERERERAREREREREPAAGDGVRPGRHAIVLLSDGQRRVGPHRLWVPWARRRAARGDLVLRLDTAGTGDSEKAVPGRAVRCGDVARAVAWLRQQADVAACSVVSIGAGAQHAWDALADEADVQRVVAIDPPLPHPGARARLAARLGAWAAAHLLRRPFAAVLASAARREVAVDLVLCGDLRTGAGRRTRALLRDGRMIASHLPQVRPGFAAQGDREALYLHLDALIHAPADGPLASRSHWPAGAVARRVEPRATPASEALRLIARASGAAT